MSESYVMFLLLVSALLFSTYCSRVRSIKLCLSTVFIYVNKEKVHPETFTPVLPFLKIQNVHTVERDINKVMK